MALAELLAAMERDAEAAAEEEVQRARREAVEILQAAQAEASRRSSGALQAYERELRAGAERRIVAARREEEREVLEARAHLLDQIFARAADLLPSADQWLAYRTAMGQEVEIGLRYLPGGSGTIFCSPKDAPAFRAAAAGRRTLKVRSSSEISAGLRIVGEGGEVEVDRTLATRLAALRPQLCIEVLRRLEAKE